MPYIWISAIFFLLCQIILLYAQKADSDFVRLSQNHCRICPYSMCKYRSIYVQLCSFFIILNIFAQLLQIFIPYQLILVLKKYFDKFERIC